MVHEADRPLKERGRGERKQITAVFVDIVGFSDIASHADAEDLQHWLAGFYAHVGGIVAAYDGEITEYLGDGVIALFGLARADELAAPKAVSAAMAAIHDITAGPDKSITLQLRAGVATGEVAVRANGAADNLPRATGMVTTLAQRIQEKAVPGTVYVSQSTQNLLRETMATLKVFDQKLKGFAQAETLYQVLPRKPAHAVPKSAFFIGREAELAYIQSRFEPCLVIGQAGIGKTALAHQIAQFATAVSTFSGDGVHTRASYQPFCQWIMQRTGKNWPEFNDIRWHFADLPTTAQRALALVLGLPEGQRLLVEKTNVALKALIEDSIWRAIKTIQPDGLLIFEDLHWLDNASFGVLAHILQSPAAKKYQILMTTREGADLTKHFGPIPIAVIPLHALNASESSRLLTALSDGSGAVVDHAPLLARAAGIPLFLEQLFQHSASDALGANTIPETLMDLLGSQIDATGSSKPVLQCAAIIGRIFDLDMLETIAKEHGPLHQHLQKASAQGLVQQIGQTRWAFAHALLHQAAYQSLLRSTRIEYHSQVAAHMLDQHGDATRRNPAHLADHLSRAQQHVPAIQNYLTVSKWALLQGAIDDAEAHVLAAISLCEQAPADIEVRDLEIACYTTLGSIRMQTYGFTSLSTKNAFEKVAALAATNKQYSTANGPAFYGSFTHAIISADKAGATRFSQLLKATADSVSADATNNEIRLASLNVDTCLHFFSGDFQSQFVEFAELCKIYDLAQHGTMISDYGIDTFAATQMFEPVGRAICGETHLIAEMSAITDDHQMLLNIPVMLPYAKIWGAVPLFYAGETTAAVARVKQGLRAAEYQSAAFWKVTGSAWLNVMDPSQSETPEGLARFDEVIETHEFIGANVGLPYFRAHYAQALARHKRLDEAYEASLRATHDNTENGLLCWYAEVLRLHANICKMNGKPDDAAQYLVQAVTVATQQNAHLWLLRARLDQIASGHIGLSVLESTLDLFDRRARPPEVMAAQRILAVQ